MIYSGGKKTTCPNCEIDAINGCSAHIYKSGGPIPFTTGSPCPTCNGVGFIYTEASDSFYMAVLWNELRAKFINLGIKLDDKTIYAQSICAIEKHPMIIKAQSAVLNTNLEGYGMQRYERESDPTPFTFGYKTYIVTLWRRAK